MRYRGFSAWGNQTGPFAACWVDFVPKCFHLFTMPPIINHKWQLLLPLRGRKEMRKGNSPKLDDTQGFQCLVHSNWTICSLLSWFCPQFFPPLYRVSYNKPNVQIIIKPERGRQKRRKGNSPKLDETQGFQCLGHSKWTICILLSWFCPHIVSPFYVASTNKP